MGNNMNIRISGSENIDIDPVQIDTSLVGQASTEYEELKSIWDVVQGRRIVTNERMKRVNEKVENLIKIAKSAIREYKIKKTERRKEELKDILIMVKNAKHIAKVLERKYMLESDSPEVEEKRRLLNGWTREQAQKDGRKAELIKDIDVPILDANDLFDDER